MKPLQDHGIVAVPDAMLDEVLARRNRLSSNLDSLGVRLQPANLMHEASTAVRSAVQTEVERVQHAVQDFGADLIEDSLVWASANRRWLVGGTAAALLAGGIAWYVNRKRTVPLYSAYDMEDPDMMSDTPENSSALDEAGAKAAGAWNRVKDQADELGSKAGEAYYSARSKAADLADNARDRAHEAAEAARDKARHAADIARERAHDAAEAARDAADRAREAADEARDWAVRQPQENPVTVVIVALAIGAILGALLPSGRRDDDHRNI